MDGAVHLRSGGRMASRIRPPEPRRADFLFSTLRIPFLILLTEMWLILTTFFSLLFVVFHVFPT